MRISVQAGAQLAPRQPPLLTCIQQQLHHGEVGMGHAVVKGRVAIVVSQVDKQLQEMWRQRLYSEEVGSHHCSVGRLPAGNTEPLLADGVQALPLEPQESPMPRGSQSEVSRPGLLSGCSQLRPSPLLC